jgi:hypothetical protein
MLAVGITHTLRAPHEDLTVVVRELGWYQLEKIREKHSDVALGTLSRIPPETLDRILEDRSKADNKDKDNIRQTGDEELPLDAYDRMELFKESVVSWSYTEEVSEENLQAMDSKTADWLFKEIVRIYHPTQEDLGNFSTPLS